MTSTFPIYLDYNGTTPHDPAVIAAMRPFIETEFGNPSSNHWYGNVAWIVGLGEACAVAARLLPEAAERMRRLRAAWPSIGGGCGCC